jgi:hypothetical protein
MRATVLALLAVLIAACGSETKSTPAEAPSTSATPVTIDAGAMARPVALDATAVVPEPECELNHDCPSHQHCADSVCTDDPVDGKRPCTINSGCPKGTNCGTGFCEKTP